MVQNCDKVLTTDESTQIVGVERAELEQSINAWNGIVKSLERDKDLLRIVIGTISVPEKGKCRKS